MVVDENVLEQGLVYCVVEHEQLQHINRLFSFTFEGLYTYTYVCIYTNTNFQVKHTLSTILRSTLLFSL